MKKAYIQGIFLCYVVGLSPDGVRVQVPGFGERTYAPWIVWSKPRNANAL